MHGLSVRQWLVKPESSKSSIGLWLKPMAHFTTPEFHRRATSGITSNQSSNVKKNLTLDTWAAVFFWLTAWRCKTPLYGVNIDSSHCRRSLSHTYYTINLTLCGGWIWSVPELLSMSHSHVWDQSHYKQEQENKERKHIDVSWCCVDNQIKI